MAKFDQQKFMATLEDIAKSLKLDWLAEQLPKPVLAKLNEVEKMTKQPKSLMVLGVVAILLLVLFFLMSEDFMLDVVGVLYPGYRTLIVLSGLIEEDFTFWLTYWVTYASWRLFTKFFGFVIMMIPFNFYLKCTFLLWLYLPSFKGTDVVREKVLKPYVFPHLTSQVTGAVKEGVQATTKGATNAAENLASCSTNSDCATRMHCAASGYCSVDFTFSWSGTATFQRRDVIDGFSAWSDKSYTFTSIPTEMLGATYLAGPHYLGPGTFTISSSQGGEVYIYSKVGDSASPDARDGGFPSLGWTEVGTLVGKNWDRLKVWKRNLAPGGTLAIAVKKPSRQNEMCGGFAFKADNSRNSLPNCVWSPERSKTRDRKQNFKILTPGVVESGSREVTPSSGLPPRSLADDWPLSLEKKERSIRRMLEREACETETYRFLRHAGILKEDVFGMGIFEEQFRGRRCDDIDFRCDLCMNLIIYSVDHLVATFLNFLLALVMRLAP
jgi:receptor expression-enhancing protein 5/6